MKLRFSGQAKEDLIDLGNTLLLMMSWQLIVIWIVCSSGQESCSITLSWGGLAPKFTWESARCSAAIT